MSIITFSKKKNSVKIVKIFTLFLCSITSIVYSSSTPPHWYQKIALGSKLPTKHKHNVNLIQKCLLNKTSHLLPSSFYIVGAMLLKNNFCRIFLKSEDSDNIIKCTFHDKTLQNLYIVPSNKPCLGTICHKYKLLSIDNGKFVPYYLVGINVTEKGNYNRPIIPILEGSRPENKNDNIRPSYLIKSLPNSYEYINEGTLQEMTSRPREKCVSKPQKSPVIGIGILDYEQQPLGGDFKFGAYTNKRNDFSRFISKIYFGDQYASGDYWISQKDYENFMAYIPCNNKRCEYPTVCSTCCAYYNQMIHYSLSNEMKENDVFRSYRDNVFFITKSAKLINLDASFLMKGLSLLDFKSCNKLTITARCRDNNINKIGEALIFFLKKSKIYNIGLENNNYLSNEKAFDAFLYHVIAFFKYINYIKQEKVFFSDNEDYFPQIEKAVRSNKFLSYKDFVHKQKKKAKESNWQGCKKLFFPSIKESIFFSAQELAPSNGDVINLLSRYGISYRIFEALSDFYAGQYSRNVVQIAYQISIINYFKYRTMVVQPCFEKEKIPNTPRSFYYIWYTQRIKDLLALKNPLELSINDLTKELQVLYYKTPLKEAKIKNLQITISRKKEAVKEINKLIKEATEICKKEASLMIKHIAEKVRKQNRSMNATCSTIYTILEDEDKQKDLNETNNNEEKTKKLRANIERIEKDMSFEHQKD